MSSPTSPGTPRAPAPDGALVTLVTGVVERAGLVLDDLDVRPAGRRTVVRVVVDADEVPGPDDDPVAGVDLDVVAAVSRELSASFDRVDEQAGTEAQGVPPGEYTLEVTTPGVDRPLTRPHHWRRAWLRRVVITLADGSEVTGRVGAVTDEGAVTVAVPGRRAHAAPELRAIALGEVARASVDVEFKPAPQAEVDALRAARGGSAPGDEPRRDDETYRQDEQGEDHT